MGRDRDYRRDELFAYQERSNQSTAAAVNGQLPKLLLSCPEQREREGECSNWFWHFVRF